MIFCGAYMELLLQNQKFPIYQLFDEMFEYTFILRTNNSHQH